MVPPMPSVADAGRRPPTHWTLAETLAHEGRTNHIPRRVRPAAPPERHVGWHAAVRDWPALPRRDAARQWRFGVYGLPVHVKLLAYGQGNNPGQQRGNGQRKPAPPTANPPSE